MKNKHMKNIIVTLGLVMSGLFTLSGTPVLLLSEDFEKIEPDSVAELLDTLDLAERKEGLGVDGSYGLRVSYVGFDRGSERVIRNIPLPQRSMVMTLSYDVRFDEDFQFVSAGKMHGLGPDHRVTGGNEGAPHRWSARVNWSGDQTIRTYIYAQQREGTFGVSARNTDFPLEQGRYYAISLVVKVNEDPEEATGEASIYVDGERIIHHENIHFRGEDSERSMISHFMFSTFHGGSTSRFAPKDADGNYTTVYADFDNFAVYDGVNVRQKPGPCWLDSSSSN
jgi:hypothetical protein